MTDEPDTRGPTIRGDQLLNAFRFLERYGSNEHLNSHPRRPVSALVFSDEAFRRYAEKIEHPFGLRHWMGEISIRSHARRTIEASMNEVSRHEAAFVIPAVVENAIEETSPTELGDLGLTADDKTVLAEVLHRFFCAVACGEISEKNLGC
ncbi:MAG: hypothetical protein WC787_01575 [Patescibacteria group bacterium]